MSPRHAGTSTPYTFPPTPPSQAYPPLRLLVSLRVCAHTHSTPQLETGNEALEAEVAAMDAEVRSISSGAKDSVRALEEAGEVAEDFQKEREAMAAAAAAPGSA